MYETVKFNIFEEHLEEVVYENNIENRKDNAETVKQLPNEQKDEKTSRLIPSRNYKQPVFKRFDWEREGTLNTL